MNKRHRDQDTFWSWLRQLRMRTLLLILCPCVMVIPIIVMWLLPAVTSNTVVDTIDSADTARRVLGLIDFDHLSGPEIQRRIQELLRIKDSVRSELRGLEQRRAGMLEEIQTLNTRLETLRLEEIRESKELERLRWSVEQVKIQQKEFILRNTPDIAPPLPILSSSGQVVTRGGGDTSDQCQSMSSCWDYSRCSITSQLPVFSYSSQSRFSQIIFESPYSVTNPDHACVYLVLDPELPENLQHHEHWAGDGRNHVLLFTSHHVLDHNYFNSRALIVSSFAKQGMFRPGVDVVIPPVCDEEFTWDKLQPLVPVLREHLLVFQGHRATSVLDNVSEEVGRQERRMVAVLQDMKLKGTTDKFMLSFSCAEVDSSVRSVDPLEWSLCGDRDSRLKKLRQSTFCLVLGPPPTTGLLSSPSLQTRALECLIAGSIPVILSSDIILPFTEVSQKLFEQH